MFIILQNPVFNTLLSHGTHGPPSSDTIKWTTPPCFQCSSKVHNSSNTTVDLNHIFISDQTYYFNKEIAHLNKSSIFRHSVIEP